MTTNISKETINRLLKDVRHIIRNPLTDNGIYYAHDDSDLLKGYALIIGPSDTPYFGGNYFFEIEYPADYPHSPPKVKYCTNGNNIRFNPNLYVCGKVCVSLLNTWRGDQWTSCQSISTMLLTLCTLLCEDPLLNEPGVDKGHKDCKSYNEIIQFANVDIAICDIIDKTQSVCMPFFDNFYPFVKENFIKNYDKLLEFAQKKNVELESVNRVYKTGFYNMTINVDYNLILERLKVSRTIVDIM
jgi:ubiquitin-conjugating enzyme E2 Z